MKVVSALIVLVVSISVTQGLFFGNSKKWDGLKVTWGVNPLNSQYFSTLPRTVADATKAGFTKISSDCSNNGKFNGNRYIKGGDYAVVLLFDNQGYIAGQQAGLPTNSNYPSRNIQPPFVADGNHYFMTAYYVNPSTICSKGRSSATFSTQGTGTDLYIQNGTNPSTTIRIPSKQSDMGHTRWVKGKCFPTMGVHYWYELSKNTDCQRMFPVFLLYNNGHLNGFGWAFNTDLSSPRYEHPTQNVFTAFMEEVPTCLASVGTISTMHIYLTSNPIKDIC
ncbi:hypothetical protein SNE40_007062 [Patella caerulea]